MSSTSVLTKYYLHRHTILVTFPQSGGEDMDDEEEGEEEEEEGYDGYGLA